MMGLTLPLYVSTSILKDKTSPFNLILACWWRMKKSKVTLFPFKKDRMEDIGKGKDKGMLSFGRGIPIYLWLVSYWKWRKYVNV